LKVVYWLQEMGDQKRGWTGKLVKDFIFSIVLGSQKNWEESSAVSHIRSSPSHAQPAPLLTPPQSGAFVITDEPTLTQYHHPKSLVFIRM
jgi:hypothetical protein